MFAAFMLVAFGRSPSRGEDAPVEWLKLVVALEKKDGCLYGPDRRFLREMINVLTLDDAVVPRAAERRWILSIKRECKL